MAVPSGGRTDESPRLSRRRLLSLLGSAAAVSLGADEAVAQLLQSPSALIAEPARPLAPPSDGTFDILHGVRIEDPFRPLEDLARADVQAWIEHENGGARQAIESDPLHAEIKAFLRRSGHYRRALEHRKVGDRFIAKVQDGTREQSWLEISDKADGEGRPLLDPNAFGADGSVSLGNYFPDRSSQQIAYLTTENGGDAQTLRVRHIASGNDWPERIVGCRFTTVVWHPDGTTFYYTRPPLATEPIQLDRTSQNIYLHKLGTAVADDALVWRLANRTNVSIAIRANYATGQLIVSGRIGTDEKMGLWIGPIQDPTQLRNIVPLGRSSFSLIQTIGETLYAITDLDAPRGRIVRVLQSEPAASRWQTIVPEQEGVIDGATTIANRLLVRTFRDFGHYLAIHDLDGRKVTNVSLGERTRISFERGERTANDIRLDIDDRRRPFRQVRLMVPTGHVEAIPSPPPPHTLEDAEVHETFARSRDGTTVPLTLMHLPGVVGNGPVRTLLYGYGSYGIPQLPGYSSLAAAWVRLGGVFAVATIRGGSEYGRNWHENGRRGQKQNAVSDFIAAAEHLIAAGVTEPTRLGMHGASSGGRLVLGAMVQRPELFGAVAAGVPLVDMLRFHHHTFGVAWKQEYGDPGIAEDFATLRALSPLHNVRSGIAYPPLLLLTADNDQRVVPSHAYKMAATMKRASPGTEVLVRTRRGAGHGTGNALSKAIEYQADILSFLTSRLGGPVRELPKI